MIKYNYINNKINNNIEHFQQSVLTSIPLTGTYNPNIKSGPKTSSSSNGQEDTAPPPIVLPITTNSYVLRSFKKPVSIVPLKNGDVDSDELKNKRLADYRASNKTQAEITKEETKFLGESLTPFSDTYDSNNRGSPVELQNALNACTKYNTGSNPCYGIVIQNTDIGLSPEALQYTSKSYTYQLVKKPSSSDSSDTELLICDPAYYTYIKDTYAKTPVPANCPPPKVDEPEPENNKPTNAPTDTESSGTKSYTYFNAPKAAPPKVPIYKNKLFLIVAAIVLVLMIGGGSYYFMYMKKSDDDDDSLKLLLKKKGGYFFFV